MSIIEKKFDYYQKETPKNIYGNHTGERRDSSFTKLLAENADHSNILDDFKGLRSPSEKGDPSASSLDSHRQVGRFMTFDSMNSSKSSLQTRQITSFDTILRSKCLIRMLPKLSLKASYKDINTTGYRLLQNQVAILKKLEHENILSLQEIIIDSSADTVYIVSEYIKHNTLLSLVDKGKMLDIAKIKEYFKEIVKGLDYCHNVAGVVHRSIRLDNILVEQNTNNIKLSETGHSFMLEKENDSQLEYIAPELLKEGNYKGTYNDIWSLGVCLFYLCEGCFPFTGPNPEAIKQAILTSKPQLKKTKEYNLINLIENCLKKDPTKRITVSQILVF